jgi:hypothetical protein
MKVLHAGLEGLLGRLGPCYRGPTLILKPALRK